MTPRIEIGRKVALTTRVVIFASLAAGVACAAQRATSITPEGAGLAGTSWQLVKFQGSDGLTLIPDDRSKYTIECGDSGQLTARVDCRRTGYLDIGRSEPGAIRSARADARTLSARLAARSNRPAVGQRSLFRHQGPPPVSGVNRRRRYLRARAGRQDNSLGCQSCPLADSCPQRTTIKRL